MAGCFYKKFCTTLAALQVLVLCCLAPAGLAQDAGITAPASEHWATNGGNFYNQRYSALDQINRDNVASLKGVWRSRLNGSGMGPPYSGEAQPLVEDGVIYIVTGANDVFAIDVLSGEHLWVYESGLSPDISTICCGWTSRGLGLGDGRIYLGRLDGKLMALDQGSGEVIWTVQAEAWEEGYSITSAPLFYDGLVITGFAGAEYASRGRVKAFNAATGELVWTFYTVPGPGEFGHETWPDDNQVWKHGGATVWQTPAVDPALGLLYFSTGNPGPDFNGAIRAGDNLFANSIVALDVKTGEYRWHFQQVHHDIWDYDAPSPVVLFDINIDGQERKGIAQIGKTAWVYLLDRVTGEPLVGINEVAVPQEPRQATAASQPVPVGDWVLPDEGMVAHYGYPRVNDNRMFTPFYDSVQAVRPGPLGGTNWPPSSYDPELGYLFVCSNDSTGRYILEEVDISDDPKSGTMYTGGPPGMTEIPTIGIMAAVNVRNNRLVWRMRWSDSCYSGSVATAGGLVFSGRNDGRFVAFDALTGNVLWEFQTGAGLNAPASVFEYRGTQYVVAYSAGNLFAGSAGGDSIWLFSLDGSLEQVQEASDAMNIEIDMDGADADAGAAVFGQYCVQCHGEDGGGGHGGGPSLVDVELASKVVQAVSQGQRTMPSFATVLDHDQIRDVTAFVIGIL